MQPTSISPAEALQRLLEGNERFVSGLRSVEAMASSARRASLVAGQRPFAVILACSDSRAPAEILFDQGLGDLFVIRVAGNVVAPSIVGSVEFAAANFGTRLAVVMGHSQCGAVDATLRSLQSGERAGSENIRDIVERIRPAVQSVLAAGAGRPSEELLREAVRANIRMSADHLRHGSRMLEDLTRSQGLEIVAAHYDLASGRVELLDETPAS